MLKKKMKHKTIRWTSALFVAGALLLAGHAHADIAPPKGQIKIKGMYAIKAPKTKLKHTFLLVETSQFNKPMLKIKPFRWGMPFSASGCYRCSARLVALTEAQAVKLLGLVEKHPSFAKDQKVLKKLQTPGKLQWLARLKFRSLTEVAQAPKAKPMTTAVVKFFREEKLAKTSSFGSKVTVPEKHKGMTKLTYFTLEGVAGADIKLKKIGESFRQGGAGNTIYGNRTRRKRRKIALARNPWFYAGMLLLLGVVFLSTRKRR